MALRDSLLAEFDREIAATRRLLVAVPDAALQWTPHARARTMGALVAHITDITSWSSHIFEATSFDLDVAPAAAPPPASMAVLLGRFTEQARGVRALVNCSDDELAAMWTLKQGGQELFSLPRMAAFRAFVLGHVVHHRGQLSIYLRMNDVAVPPIYGPTADSRPLR